MVPARPVVPGVLDPQGVGVQGGGRAGPLNAREERAWAAHQLTTMPPVLLRARTATDPVAAAGLDVAAEPGPPGVAPVRVPAFVAAIDTAPAAETGPIRAMQAGPDVVPNRVETVPRKSRRARRSVARWVLHGEKLNAIFPASDY